MNNNMDLLKEAKEKLRWYTMEASQEEFDVEEVDILVNLIQKLEAQQQENNEEMETKLERFRAYCDMRIEEEERLTSDITKDNVIHETKAPNKKVFRLGGKMPAMVAAAACLVMFVVLGSTIGMVNAGPDGGFFHWLRRDTEGATIITSPDKVDAEAGKQKVEQYLKNEDVPEEYKQYMVEKEKLESLKDYEWKCFNVRESAIVKRLSTVFVCGDTTDEIEVGRMLYPEDILIAKENFMGYELRESNFVDGRQQDVFARLDVSGVEEYCIFFYDGNVRYFVFGKENIAFLKTVSEEYMNLIFAVEE